jgi:hypothetical protein
VLCPPPPPLPPPPFECMHLLQYNDHLLPMQAEYFYVTMLRNPVDLYISQYMFGKSGGGTGKGSVKDFRRWLKEGWYVARFSTENGTRGCYWILRMLV